jgi:hypothetical protein
MRTKPWLTTWFSDGERRRVVRARPAFERLEDRLAPALGIPLQSLADPNTPSADHFGSSVAVAGNTMLIGAPEQAETGPLGAVYLTDTSGDLLHIFTDPNTGQPGNFTFGMQAAIAGNTVLIGADDGIGAYLFNSSGTLLQTFSDPGGNGLADVFGSTVALAGSNVLIGAYGRSNNMGAAFLFNRSGALLHTFADPGNTANDAFGAAVALSSTNVLIGAYGTGGTKGAAYLYDTSGNLLHTFTDPGNTGSDEFGWSVALTGDAVLIGAPGTNTTKGAAYLYDTSGNLLHTYTDPNNAPNDLFGSAVALSGSDVLIGEFGVNTFTGAAYLYDTSGNLLQSFTNPRGATGDDFGRSVAVAGSNLLIGAGNSKGGPGAAYLYGSVAALNGSTGDNRTTTVGTLFASPPTIEVLDALGNPVADATISFTEANGPNGAGGSFNGNATVTNAQGLAVAPPLIANGVAGSFTITAHYGTLLATTLTLTNLPGSPAALMAAGGDHQAATVATTFAMPPTALVLDALGNPVGGALVSFSVANGPGGASGSFGGQTTVPTNDQGLAVAPPLAANSVAGRFTVSAHVGASLSTTFVLTNLPGPANKLAVVTVPASVFGGAGFSMQVDVEDNSGNRVSADASVVTVELNGPGPFSAGTATAQAVDGIASFDSMAIEKAGTYILSFSAPGLTGASAPLTVNPPLGVGPPTLPAPGAAVPYSQAVTASGGTAPYSYAVSGTLPPGLSLNSTTGQISGTPTTGGSYRFTVTAADAGTGPPVSQSYTLTTGPVGVTYDPASQTLTIAASSFGYSQRTTQDAAGLHTTFTFTVNGAPLSLPDMAVAHVIVTGPGNGSASLVTNDTYTGTDNMAHETAEQVVLGGSAGQLYRAGVLFAQLSGFSTIAAVMGQADYGTILGTAGVQNTFVSAGGYAYMDSGTAIYSITGAQYVYGRAANTYDTAYHYDGSGASFLQISGTAYSFMLGTDNGQKFFNEAVNFQTNDGIARHSGQDSASFYDSPNNDVFVGHTTTSYLYADNPSGNLVEYDQALGFALVDAYSFVGGTDYAYVYDPVVNHVSGFLAGNG